MNLFKKKIFAMASIGAAATLLSFSAFGQTVALEDVTITQGSSGDAVLSWVDAGSDAVGIQVDNITYTDDSDIDVTVFVTDVFSGDEEVCNTGGTTIAPNINVSCNASFTTILIVHSSNQPIGDRDYAVFRFEADGGAAEQTITLNGNWQSFNNVGGDLGDGTFSADITIVEVPPTDANLVIAPASHDFGTQDINDGAQTFDFTLSNDGEDDSLEIGTASVGGAPYSVSGNCDGETLTPGGSCVVTVTFAPAAAGTFSDTLTVTSDVNTVTADLDGAATATANIVINPPFGPVNLGVGAPGDTLSANGTVSNTGSEEAAVACTLSGDPVFSTDPSPLAATIGPGETVPFSLACALPGDAEEGDSFSGTLSCDIDGEFAGEHQLSCGVSTFEPLPVPTMQAWALALFALMMLLAGAIGIRFFRA